MAKVEGKTEVATTATTTTAVAKKSNEPNLKLAAKHEPLGAGAVTVGMEIVASVPDEAAQRAGFFTPDAEALMLAYPGKYKLIQSKGE